MKNILFKKFSGLSILLIACLMIIVVSTQKVSAADNYQYSAFSEPYNNGFARIIHITSKDDLDGENIIGYCFNIERHLPDDKGYKNPNNYERVEATGDVISKYMEISDFYKNDKELFRRHINKVIMLGYNNNAKGLLDGMTDQEMYDITQMAIWHFTDRSVRPDYYGYEVESFIKNHFYGNNPKFSNPEKAEKAFREMISDEGLDQYADVCLEFYISENESYQNLMAAKRFESTEPITLDGNLTVKKEVSGNVADYNKTFDFEIKLWDEDDKKLSGKYEIVSGENIIEQGSFDGGILQVCLGHNQALEITELPNKYAYEVTEKGAEQYDTYINDSVTSCKSIKGNEESSIVEFENVKEMSVPTGIDSPDSKIFLLFLINQGLVFVMIIRVFHRRKEKFRI